MKKFRTAAYIRLSREDGDREESDSVVNQKKLLQNFICAREDLELKAFYVDDGFTGTNFERPDFRRMMEDIRQGEIDCVAVKDLSRFGRDYIDTGRYLERLFPEMGVRFISVTDQIDSSRKSYDMLLPIKNIFNEQYARDISEKIQATMREKQKAGEFIGAFASYGYRKSPADRNRLVIDPYAAEIVRRIFEMFLQGVGKQAIARRLNREGILCPAAYKAVSGQNYRNGNCPGENPGWTYSTVNSILHKEIYAGDMVQGTRHQRMRGRQKRVPREDWIIVRETHEPVVDRDTWEKAQKLLGKRVRETYGAQENIFAGFLRCGDCGAAMVRTGWKRGGGRAWTFYCGTYKRKGKTFCLPHGLPLEAVSGIIRRDLKLLLEASDFPEELLLKEAGRQKRRQTEGEGEKLEAELRKIQKLRQSVYEDFREGILSREEFESYREIYRQKEQLCCRRIQEFQSRKEKKKKKKCREARQAFEYLRETVQGGLTRKMLEALVERITVYEGCRLRIVYRFSGECGDLFPEGYQISCASDTRHMEAEIREK